MFAETELAQVKSQFEKLKRVQGHARWFAVRRFRVNQQLLMFFPVLHVLIVGLGSMLKYK